MKRFRNRNANKKLQEDLSNGRQQFGYTTEVAIDALMALIDYPDPDKDSPIDGQIRRQQDRDKVDDAGVMLKEQVDKCDLKPEEALRQALAQMRREPDVSSNVNSVELAIHQAVASGALDTVIVAQKAIKSENKKQKKAAKAAEQEQLRQQQAKHDKVKLMGDLAPGLEDKIRHLRQVAHDMAVQDAGGGKPDPRVWAKCAEGIVRGMYATRSENNLFSAEDVEKILQCITPKTIMDEEKFVDEIADTLISGVPNQDDEIFHVTRPGEIWTGKYINDAEAQNCNAFSAVLPIAELGLPQIPKESSVPVIAAAHDFVYAKEQDKTWGGAKQKEAQVRLQETSIGLGQAFRPTYYPKAANNPQLERDVAAGHILCDGQAKIKAQTVDDFIQTTTAPDLASWIGEYGHSGALRRDHDQPIPAEVNQELIRAIQDETGLIPAGDEWSFEYRHELDGSVSIFVQTQFDKLQDFSDPVNPKTFPDDFCKNKKSKQKLMDANGKRQPVISYQGVFRLDKAADGRYRCHYQGGNVKVNEKMLNGALTKEGQAIVPQLKQVQAPLQTAQLEARKRGGGPLKALGLGSNQKTPPKTGITGENARRPTEGIPGGKENRGPKI